MGEMLPECARCSLESLSRACRNTGGKGPPYCPTLKQAETIGEALRCYDRPEMREFARQASLQEAECYINREKVPHLLHPVKPRLQEICEFAARMSYRRLGLAFCAGLHSEAAALTKVLVAQGFSVVSVVCKVGCIPKEEIGISDAEKVRVGTFESMCNPIAQAEVLNRAETEFNIVVGLCVGHDSLFFKHAQAPTTVFAVKDRVLAHNPLAVLYTLHSYTARFLQKNSPGTEPGHNR
jgi:uncharacterized metal-binding protein